MRSGQLDSRVSIILTSDSATVDTGGHIVHDGATRLGGRRWARVEVTGVSEAFDGEVLRSSLDATLIMRADKLTRRLTSRDAIVFDGRSYQVVSVAVNDRAGVVTVRASSLEGADRSRLPP